MPPYDWTALQLHQEWWRARSLLTGSNKNAETVQWHSGRVVSNELWAALISSRPAGCAGCQHWGRG